MDIIKRKIKKEGKSKSFPDSDIFTRPQTKWFIESL